MLRRATAADLPFLSELATNAAVEPFLMPGAGDAQRLEGLLELGRDAEGPDGLFVIESGRKRVGALVLQTVNARSRICAIGGLMVAPGVRRGGIATAAVRLACARALAEYGLHRVQAEVYGANTASQRLFESAGFTREGVRRRAYLRDDGWRDGVLYGLLADEFGPGGA